jgi:hypothetical protein
VPSVPAEASKCRKRLIEHREKNDDAAMTRRIQVTIAIRMKQPYNAEGGLEEEGQEDASIGEV